MKVPFVIASLLFLFCKINSVQSSLCDRDVKLQALQAFYKYYVNIYKQTATQSNDHFVVSFNSIYLSLAGLAEGATGSAQEDLFKALNLPDEECLRRKYYELLNDQQLFSKNFSFNWEKTLALDETAIVNKTWTTNVLSWGLLDDVLSVPLKLNPQVAAERIAKTLRSKSSIIDTDFSGNSVLLDFFEYNGLWKTSFPEAQIERNAPFYNEFGVQTGTVDLMHTTQKMRYSIGKDWNVKMIFIPVGKMGEYTFIFLQTIDRRPIQEAVELITIERIADVLSNVHEIPMRLAIPKFTMFSEHENMRNLLKTVGVNNLWVDPEASLYVSNPAALPSAYVQHVSVRVCTSGVEEYVAPVEMDSVDNQITTSDEDAVIGHEFIVNKPFLFGIIHTSTKLPIFAGAFSRPRNNYLSQM